MSIMINGVDYGKEPGSVKDVCERHGVSWTQMHLMIMNGYDWLYKHSGCSDHFEFDKDNENSCLNVCCDWGTGEFWVEQLVVLGYDEVKDEQIMTWVRMNYCPKCGKKLEYHYLPTQEEIDECNRQIEENRKKRE